MSRMYTVQFSGVAVTAQTDLFELTPADDKPIEIVGLFLGQTTDFGDAQDEVLQLQIIRGFTTSGSGGSAPTPVPVKFTDAAAAFTAEVNNTTVANTGTTTTVHTDTWNVRAGYSNWWIPDTEPQATQANTTIVVRMAAPADSITCSGTLYVREQ